MQGNNESEVDAREGSPDPNAMVQPGFSSLSASLGMLGASIPTISASSFLQPFAPTQLGSPPISASSEMNMEFATSAFEPRGNFVPGNEGNLQTDAKVNNAPAHDNFFDNNMMENFMQAHYNPDILQTVLPAFTSSPRNINFQHQGKNIQSEISQPRVSRKRRNSIPSEDDPEFLDSDAHSSARKSNSHSANHNLPRTLDVYRSALVNMVNENMETLKTYGFFKETNNFANESFIKTTLYTACEIWVLSFGVHVYDLSYDQFVQCILNVQKISENYYWGLEESEIERLYWLTGACKYSYSSLLNFSARN